MGLAAKLPAAGLAAAVYAGVEPHLYRVAERVVPLARPSPIETILHFSDSHLRSRNERLTNFIQGLPEALGEPPDLIVATGDLIEDNSGIEPLLEALSGLESRWGSFYVLGSHDYHQAQFQSFAKYFRRRRNLKSARPADTDRLEAGLQTLGWRSLTNRSQTIYVRGAQIRLAGVDDPYIDRHEVGHIGTSLDDALAIALVHAPDVVSEWALEGFDLILAGHTHGGQIRAPGAGAIVTNCSLPAGLAKGLHRVGRTWLHVSPGLGTSTYAPVRFCCPPEVTLLRIEPDLP